METFSIQNQRKQNNNKTSIIQIIFEKGDYGDDEKDNYKGKQLTILIWLDLGTELHGDQGGPWPPANSK